MSILTLPVLVDELAERQMQLVTRAQLAAAGVTAAMVRRRLVSQWRLPLPGVVHLGRAPLTVQQRLVAAQLLAGPASIITGAAACRWHGLRNAQAACVDVLVPMRQARREVSFVRVSRTDRPPSFTTGAGVVRVAPVARAVADTCRHSASARDAEALVIEAVQSGRSTLAALTDELVGGPRQRSASLRAGLAAASSGAWSAPEHDLFRHCRQSPQLPEAWLNPELRAPNGKRLPTPDLWIDDVGLAIQVHSARHHASAEDWTRTVRTDSALAEAGVLRLSVTPREIATEPAAVVARIEAMFSSLSPLLRPRVIATRRPTP
jgi:plasmid stability protein